MKRESVIITLLIVVGSYAKPATAQETVKVSIINAERKEVGQANITDGPNGVIVALSLREKPAGIPPGAHGFHIHAVGKCEPPFKSAGDHFAPQKKGHGFCPRTARMPEICPTFTCLKAVR